jgi:anti-sigma regulatory factor (Ser/Thr protein kinase)
LTDTPALRLVVPASAENVSVIRQALAGLAEALEMDSGALADLKTAVTEACMNVVVHAYPDGEGPLEVTAVPDEKTLTVRVIDRGAGIQPRPPDPDDTSLRLGLALIASLSSAFSISGGHERGTEVQIEMRIGANGDGAAASDHPVPAVAAGTELSIASGAMVRPVLARVIAILAARADFSIDRLSDAVLIGDAVSAHAASDPAQAPVGIRIEDADGSLNVSVGPLPPGAAQRMLENMEIPGIGASLAQLVDETRVEVAEDGSGERLVLCIAQPR